MRNYRDLIIVVSICCVFALLGTGMISKISSKSAYCANNLRTLYTMLQSYENDHGGVPPVTIPQKPRWRFWSHCLASYSDSQLDFCCPADPRVAYMFERNDPLFSFRKRATGSYGMNYRLTAEAARRARAKEPKIRYMSRPDKVIVFGDSNGPYMLPPRFWEHEKAFRHRDETANFIFADGNVKLLKQQDMGRYGEDGRFFTDFTMWYWN